MAKTNQNNMTQHLGKINRQFKEKSIMENAQKLGYGYIDIERMPIDADAVQLIPRETAEKGLILPFGLRSNNVSIGLVDPENQTAQNEIKRLQDQGYHISLNLCSREGLMAAIDTNRERYAAIDYFNVQEEAQEKAKEIEITEEKNEIQDISKTFQENSAAEIMAKILSSGSAMGASDIHLETYEQKTRIRFRIDGFLHDIIFLPNDNAAYLKKELKFKSKMKLNITNIPQDGRFFIRIGGRKVDLRISVIPSYYGESFVVRLLDSSKNQLTIDDLGLPKSQHKLLERNIQRSQGLVLFTGPTGSGKTTSLYAILQNINEENRKIITIEDPIEYEILGVEQTEVDLENDYTFGNGLKSILRHDPDVVLIGEVRDETTANTTMNAALTGHLVFSTLHTNSAPGALSRLMHIGVPSYVLGPALSLVVAQRLVRKLCPHCKTPHKLSNSEKKVFTQVGIQDLEHVYEAKGCEQCNNTGYHGRFGLFEMLELTDGIRSYLSSAENEYGTVHIDNDKLTQIAKDESDYKEILEQGLESVAHGKTSLSEIFRVVY